MLECNLSDPLSAPFLSVNEVAPETLSHSSVLFFDCIIEFFAILVC